MEGVSEIQLFLAFRSKLALISINSPTATLSYEPKMEGIGQILWELWQSVRKVVLEKLVRFTKFKYVINDLDLSSLIKLKNMLIWNIYS